MFYFVNRAFISNYTDDNVLYAFGSKLEEFKTRPPKKLRPPENYQNGSMKIA